VAPELLAELREPFSQLWSLLESRYGAREAARLLARILGAMVDHGEEVVAAALEATLQIPRQDLPEAMPLASRLPREVPVPQALRGYQVEAARAADYDALLLRGVR
jgi:hypothetical protein